MSLVDRLITVDRAESRRICVVGDPMTDVYVHGRLDVCQDGCQKFVEDRRVTVVGGAGNAARSLGGWCARVWFLFDRCRPSIKTRFMDGDRVAFRHDDDVNYRESEFARREALVSLGVRRPDAVLISDYDKGLMDDAFIREVIGYCRGRGIPCVADAKRDPSVYEGAILEGNGDYFRRFDPRKIKDSPLPRVITCGAAIPIVETAGNTCTVKDNLLPVQCINHVGAGDCFAAHLTLALAHGLSLKEAAAVAHSAGRVYVQHRHNRPPHPEEIRADMEACVESVV